MKKEYVRHGGKNTPQYYCPLCKHAHTVNSRIGRLHFRYRRK